MVQAMAHRARPWLAAATCLALLGALPACTGTLPDHPAGVASSRSDVPVRAELSASSPTAVAAVTPSADASASASDSPAVALRFPEPSVTYATPALQDRKRSGFTSQAELHSLLLGLTREASPAVRVVDLGQSQLGTSIEALVLASGRDASAVALQRNGRPTVLLVGQQHGDEPASSEALMVMAQELARGKLKPLLDRVNVVILPRANPDGAQTGQRVTVNGMDTELDHLVLETPEARAMARVVREFQPTVVVEVQEYGVSHAFRQKFGVVQRHDAMFQYATVANMPVFVTRAAEEWFRQPMLASLKQHGLTAEWSYRTSADVKDAKVSMGGIEPSSARNANGLKNAISVAVASRGAGLGRVNLKRRVHTHVVALTSLLNSAASRGGDLLKIRQYVDAEISAQACQGQVVVEAAPTAAEYTLPGLDPVTGADKVLDVSWDSSLALRTLKLRTRPCGYWLAADQSTAAARLRSLGVRVDMVSAVGVMQAEVYVAGSTPQQELSTSSNLIDVPVGSYYVPLSQPLANLAIAALEPDTEHSYLTHRIVSELRAQARVMALPGVRLTVMP